MLSLWASLLESRFISIVSLFFVLFLLPFLFQSRRITCVEFIPRSAFLLACAFTHILQTPFTLSRCFLLQYFQQFALTCQRFSFSPNHSFSAPYFRLPLLFPLLIIPLLPSSLPLYTCHLALIHFSYPSSLLIIPLLHSSFPSHNLTSNLALLLYFSFVLSSF